MLNLIIPLYNSLETLSKCLDSVVAQTKKMFLVTLVNDCDGNDYSEIITEYKRRGLHISYIEREINGGPGAARQTGIDSNDMCDYVMFMDADDMLMPRAIEILYREAKMGQYDIVISQFISEHNQGSMYMDARIQNTAVWLHGKIYRVAYLKEHDIHFNPNIKFNEDTYFNNVALNSTENKIGIDELTYIWRNNPNSVTRSKFVEFNKTEGREYVTAVTESSIKLYNDGNISQDLFIKMILALYHSYIVEEYYYDEYKSLDLLKEYSKQPFIKEYMEMKNSYEYIATHVNGGTVLPTKDYYFPKLNFQEWLDLWYKKDVD